MRSMFLSVFAVLLSAAVWADDADKEKNKDDARFQGEYVGSLAIDGGSVAFGVHVIALGNGRFDTVGYRGGLPGDGWDAEKLDHHEGQREGDAVVVRTDAGISGRIQDGKIFVEANGVLIGTLEKKERKSPTLGAKPPAGAVVLFDGKNTDRFPGAKMTDDGLLIAGATSADKFQSFSLHVEFLLPLMPAERGQARGNSGVYSQGRYEVQILDSFGLEGKDNECGGIYGIKAPDVNLCFPPLTWQTYDIDFIAAKVATDGKKSADARISVKHNGVEIHRNVALPRSTTAAPVAEGPEPGPIYLQDHGNPVRFRNIWVVRKD